MKKKFNWRAFLSLYIVYSFIIITISGIILYLAPPGRIANWTNLTILGFTKHEWQSIHTIFTFVFIIAIGFHIFFNWKPIIFYLRKKRDQHIKIKAEFFIVSLFVLIIFSMVYLNLPPFDSVITLGENLSDSWDQEMSSPPIPHAELLNINELANQLNFTPDSIVSILHKSGIYIESLNMPLVDIAQQNKLSPNEVYRLINPEISLPVKDASSQIRRGFGRKTLVQISQEMNISVEILINNLAKNGIEATPESKIRDIANTQGISPRELMDQIESLN